MKQTNRDQGTRTEGRALDVQTTDTTQDSSDTELMRRLHVQLWEATSTALLLSCRDLSTEGEPTRRVCFQLGLLLRVLARRTLFPLDVARTPIPGQEVSHGK